MLIPIVEAPDAVDERQPGRPSRSSTQFKESRLVLARSREEFQPKFGATFGTPDDAGDSLLDCAIAAGMGANTQVHGSAMVLLGLPTPMLCLVTLPPIC